ncbi:hypothetical protein OE810_04655 [Rhodobacteraceae bacterium XHP0102]|nr:hypothetical protein [Rhodobacteraceae bacterium XHP0102]
MKLEQQFHEYCYAQVGRILTQLDRDPDSPTYGCFDRNYWHYKIRDFPSSILQQGAFLLESLRQQPNEILTKEVSGEWALAAINALSRQAEPTGAVDEYYPFEDSYPASAFALYCASKVLLDWKNKGFNSWDRLHWSGLRKLARRLSQRQELQAANQYAAGVAALSMASKFPQLEVCPKLVREHADRLFDLQDSEGWFQEYGGPDFGYLSVTIDALVDYHDVTQDKRALTAIDNAVSFLANMIGCDGELPWTLNARNTDYVVPYGLVRSARRNPLASWVVCRIFQNIEHSSHFIWATDDRYLLHYIYSSIVRSLPYLNEMLTAEPPSHKEKVWYPSCGFLVRNYSNPPATVYVGAHKGGVLRVHRALGAVGSYDNGWRLHLSDGLWTTNWWQRAITVENQKDFISIKGCFVPYKPMISTPTKHVVLRVLAKLVGRKLTSVLKNIMIFRRSKRNSPQFQRVIQFDNQARTVRVHDAFAGSNAGRLVNSPRQNLRHVASADSFSVEDNLGLVDFLHSQSASNNSEGFRRIDF